MKDYLIKDEFFRVEVLSKSERPNLLIYLAMHQDYSENAVADELEKLGDLPESVLGKRIVDRCVKFGHWGVIEHPSITFNVIGFPHSVISQARTHRVGVSFDVQSMRYTSQRFIDCARVLYKLDLLTESRETIFSLKKKEIENIIYFRPVSKYVDRNGNKYLYDEYRDTQIKSAEKSIKEYYDAIVNRGLSPEHARGNFLYDFRQHFVITFNLRSLLHFLDLRFKSDAQLEIQTLSEMLWVHCKEWVPEISAEYEKKRLGKNKLSP